MTMNMQMLKFFWVDNLLSHLIIQTQTMVGGWESVLIDQIFAENWHVPPFPATT